MTNKCMEINSVTKEQLNRNHVPSLGCNVTVQYRQEAFTLSNLQATFNINAHYFLKYMNS